MFFGSEGVYLISWALFRVLSASLLGFNLFHKSVNSFKILIAFWMILIHWNADCADFVLLTCFASIYKFLPKFLTHIHGTLSFLSLSLLFFFGSRDQTQDLECARQALYHWTTWPAIVKFFEWVNVLGKLTQKEVLLVCLLKHINPSLALE
jgi:hypothetical protein